MRSPFVANLKNEVPERVRDDERDPVLHEADGRDNGAPMCHDYPGSGVRGLAAVGVALWCVSVLAIGVNLAEFAWEWAWIFGLGTVVPALFLWQIGRLLTPVSERFSRSARYQEKELLKALSERGELTPVTVALRASLTASEAAQFLEALAGKGHLQLRVVDGIQVYAFAT
jgi:hypothetical protein